MTGNSLKRAVTDQTHGLRTDAQAGQVKHETGLGTQDVLIMRPNKVPGMIWFGLAFFGLGAVFYVFVVLPSPTRTTQDVLVFAGLFAFTFSAMVLIEQSHTRIVLRHDSLERHRVLHRSETVRFSDIQSVTPMAKTFSYGLTITTQDQKRYRIAARFSGYATLMARLSQFDPQLGLLAKLAKAQHA